MGPDVEHRHERASLGFKGVKRGAGPLAWVEGQAGSGTLGGVEGQTGSGTLGGVRNVDVAPGLDLSVCLELRLMGG